MYNKKFYTKPIHPYVVLFFCKLLVKIYHSIMQSKAGMKLKNYVIVLHTIF